MENGAVLSRKNGGIKTIIINREKRRNALDPDTAKLLLKEVERTKKEGDVRVMVLTGAGSSFCAGADLKWMPDGDAMANMEERTWGFQNLIKEIFYLPMPTIAAVRGHAVGFGCSLALACDIRIASEEARMGVLFTKIGLMTDGGASYFLPRLVGLSKTLELLYTADVIDAQEALRIGLVNRVVKSDDFETAVDNLSRRLARGATMAYRLSKETVLEGLSMNINAALEKEVQGQLRCVQSADFVEGVMAFLQKREPDFKGA